MHDDEEISAFNEAQRKDGKKEKIKSRMKRNDFHLVDSLISSVFINSFVCMVEVNRCFPLLPLVMLCSYNKLPYPATLLYMFYYYGKISNLPHLSLALKELAIEFRGKLFIIIFYTVVVVIIIFRIYVYLRG